MDPLLAMIFLFGSNFAPQGYLFCSGQLLSIASNTAVFSLLGTTYGGNGTNNFQLPDLRGRVPLGQGQGPGLSNYVLGQASGTETDNCCYLDECSKLKNIRSNTGDFFGN